MAALIVFHVEDVSGNPVGGALVQGDGDTRGHWQGLTNACGDFQATLDADHYALTVSAGGYATRTLPADLADCGVVNIGLERGSGGALPPIPARGQVCAVQETLQGLDYTTSLGAFPAWGLEVFSDADLASAFATHHAVGDTHVHLELTGAYNEPGTLWPDVILHGKDYAYDLPSFKALLRKAIVAGFFPDVPLGGDGMSIGASPAQGEYNDPVGLTYGFQWLMNNLARILTAIRGDAGSEAPGEDLTPYCIFRPGWDSCFYGWGSDPRGCAVRFGSRFRSILPNGNLAIEHTPGNIPLGGGAADFTPGGAMADYDTALGEFDWSNMNTVWQVLGRMLPNYNRPPDQIGDPTPPKYLPALNRRGLPFLYNAYEFAEYEYSHQKIDKTEVQRRRTYLRNCGALYVG